MFNFALIQKVLEIRGEASDQVEREMTEIAKTVNDLYLKYFILYIEKHIKGDDELDKFANFVEGFEKSDEKSVEDFSKWVKENTNIDLLEFEKEVESKLHDLEMDLIKSLKTGLNQVQIRALIDFTEGQRAEVKVARDDYVKILENIENIDQINDVQGEAEQVSTNNMGGISQQNRPGMFQTPQE